MRIAKKRFLSNVCVHEYTQRNVLLADENSPHLAPAPHKSKKALQYPSKDRIEFICHALNMGISPFARRAHEA